MATTPSVTIESHLSVKSPTVDVCSSNMMPLQRISTSSPTTMKSSPMSADINQLSALSSGQAQLLFNRLVSVDLSQQQNSNNLLVEDQRTLQLALELSIVGLSDAAAVKEPLNSNNNCNEFNIHEQHYQQIAISRVQKEKMSDKFDINTMKGIKTPIPAIANNVNSEGNNIGFKPSDKSSRSSSATFNQLSVSNPMLITALEDRSKKSQNMTECVPVPSSEHVAEIVGRQGCKIKALRAKTNTYIKTPVRGEEPVFVVTGRKEDVAKAKREILSAAEHFSLIRATRKPSFDTNMSGTFYGNNCGANSFGKIPSLPPSIPGQVTIQVRVPYRVVGLVVGPKGATIKHIQHQTQTYIVTPSREKEPIFEVSGLPDNVQLARKQIEAHIALRTGNLPPNGGSNMNSVILSDSSNDTLTAHSLNVLSQILNDPSIDSDIIVSLCKTDSGRTGFDYGDGNLKISNKKTDIQDLKLPDNIDKFNFNTESRKSSSVEIKPHSLLKSDSTSLQNLDSTRQFSDYVSGLINNCNLKEASNPASDLLTDLEQQSHNTRLQQPQNLYPPSTSIINNQLLPSPSLSPLQANQTVFLGNVGSYMQTISFSNNLTAVYNAQSTACASITSAVASSNVKNSNHTTHNSNAYSGMARSCSSASSTASSKSANNSGCGSRPELINIWKNLGDSLDMDEGIGDSPNIWNLPASLTTLTGSHCSPSTSISPTDSLLGEISAHTHQNSGNQNRLNESQLETNNYKHFLQHPNFQCENSEIQRRDCLVCKKKEITAALVPCGHNMFCMDCANRICELGDSICPVCNLNVYHAMRILA